METIVSVSAAAVPMPAAEVDIRYKPYCQHSAALLSISICCPPAIIRYLLD